MASRKKYDAVATVGEYKNAAGETKKRYLNVGTVFENDEGQLSMKLDALPISKDWSGYISFYEPKDRQEPGRDRTAQEAVRREPSGQSPSTVTGADGIEDDLPF